MQEYGKPREARHEFTQALNLGSRFPERADARQRGVVSTLLGDSSALPGRGAAGVSACDVAGTTLACAL